MDEHAAHWTRNTFRLDGVDATFTGTCTLQQAVNEAAAGGVKLGWQLVIVATRAQFTAAGVDIERTAPRHHVYWRGKRYVVTETPDVDLEPLIEIRCEPLGGGR